MQCFNMADQVLHFSKEVVVETCRRKVAARDAKAAVATCIGTEEEERVMVVEGSCKNKEGAMEYTEGAVGTYRCKEEEEKGRGVVETCRGKEGEGREKEVVGTCRCKVVAGRGTAVEGTCRCKVVAVMGTVVEGTCICTAGTRAMVEGTCEGNEDARACAACGDGSEDGASGSRGGGGKGRGDSGLGQLELAVGLAPPQAKHKMRAPAFCIYLLRHPSSSSSSPSPAADDEMSER
ncbi:hypothetical protein GOP47_0019166 [Adiantum capillus-veneris]|uniref:Uncharacterized protein n=1 Tax=Adiantum capillus-veneris TaxID=13818 RepID=A0A9D4UF34_ADICA|nr:hypothetical protein GOP47_0019166 [Adiantum capillus-veneris]